MFASARLYLFKVEIQDIGDIKNSGIQSASFANRSASRTGTIMKGRPIK
jgi:hypothetical protein